MTCILRTIHGFPRIFCDETPLPVLEKGRRRTRKCQLWAHAVDDRPWQGPAPPAVAYVFATGRDTEAIIAQLGDRFAGVMQVDGYGAYKALARRTKPGRIRLAFCLAHARRKFVAVHKTTQSPRALEVVAADRRDLCHRGAASAAARPSIAARCARLRANR